MSNKKATRAEKHTAQQMNDRIQDGKNESQNETGLALQGLATLVIGGGGILILLWMAFG